MANSREISEAVYQSTDEQFVVAWQQAATMEIACDDLGVEVTFKNKRAMTQRARMLRDLGIPLKPMARGMAGALLNKLFRTENKETN